MSQEASPGPVVEKSPAKARVSAALPVEMLCGSSFMSTVSRCKLFIVKMSKSKWFTWLKQNIKETTEEFLQSLDLLFDIGHNQATSLISHNPCKTKSMIAQDLKFLEDQRSGRKMELGNMDKEYCMKDIRKACPQREELQRFERDHCRLTKTQTINGAACSMAIMVSWRLSTARHWTSWSRF